MNSEDFPEEDAIQFDEKFIGMSKIIVVLLLCIMLLCALNLKMKNVSLNLIYLGDE